MGTKGMFLVGLLASLVSFALKAQTEQMNIYLIPGQGGDHRLFNNLEFNDRFEVKHIYFETPGQRKG